MKHEDKGIAKKMPAPNERFHAMAGVAPHKRQCELASFVPARTVVSPPLREAATTLGAMGDAVSSSFFTATCDNV